MPGNDNINSRLEYILDDYDRRLNNFHMIVGGLVVIPIILFFFMFKTGYDYSLWKSILWTLISGVGVLIVGSLIALAGVAMIVASAREKFNLNFPFNSPRRKIAIAALSNFDSESEIEKELLKSLFENKTAYVEQTESPPDYQLEQALDQIQTESNDSSAKFQAQQQPAKQPLSQSATMKQPINPYGRVLLQPAKKIMMKTQDKAEKEKFIMLDPEKKNE
jgi:cytochrome c oxidase subunit IV